MNKLGKILIFFLLLLLFNINNSNAAWLGVQMSPVNEEVIEFYKFNKNTLNKVLINGVIKGSAAQAANLLPGDIILEINNEPIKTIEEVINNIAKFSAGQNVNIKIIRKNSEKIIKVKLREKPNNQNFEFVDGSEKFTVFEFGVIFAFDRFIVNTKYFPKETLEKYQKDGLVVACVLKGSNAEKQGIKLFDEIILIDGKKPTEAWPIKGKLTQLTIKRNNKILKKTILPTPVDTTIPIQCTSEFSDLECAELGPAPGSDPGIVEWAKKFLPVLDCCIKKNVSVVPFHNLFATQKRDFFSLKIQALEQALYYYQYAKVDLLEGLPDEHLDKLNEIIDIARKDLNELDKFFEIYPEIEKPKQYFTLQTRIKNTTLYASGTHADTIKSQQDKIIHIDPEDISRVKKNILYKIKKTNLNNEDTIKYLTNQFRYLFKAKEYEFIVENWNRSRKETSWSNNNLFKYFDNVYGNLAEVYFQTKNLKKGFEVLSEGMKISKNNFQNLHFKSAYGAFLTKLTTVKLVHKLNEEEMLKNFALLEQHVNHLNSLSNEDKQKLKKINKNYFIEVIMVAAIFDMLEPKSSKASKYPQMGIDYIIQNPELDLYIAKPIMMATLIQASLIDDDIDTYNTAKGELDILVSESTGNQDKLRSLLNPSGQLISQYYATGLYSEMEEWIEFVYETFDTEKLRKDFIYKINLLIVDYFKAYSEKRHGNLNEAILINEKLVNDWNVTGDMSNLNFQQFFVIMKSLPDLYELYYLTENKQKFKELNTMLFFKDIQTLTKRDFENLELVGGDSFVIYKTMAKYYLQNNSKEQFTKLVKFTERKIINYLKELKEMSSFQSAAGLMNKQDIFKNIVEIAQIFIEGGKTKEGKNILDFLFPQIISYYNEQIYQSIWRPNVQDKNIGNVYLEVASYFQNNVAFQQKAYSVAQIAKNTNMSRDMMKSISKNNLKKDDDENLINRYQNLQQKLLVLSRGKQFQPKESKDNKFLNKKFSDEYRKIQRELLSVENLIKKQNPEYFDFLKIKTADIKDLQKLLDDEQAILDYFFSNSRTHIVLIKKDSFKIYNVDSDYKYLTNLNKQIRKSLLPHKGEIIPFEVNKSFQLNESIFLFLKDELKSTNKLIIVPDGPLNSLPLHVLATKSEKNCLDCRTVKFNLNDYAFSYLPTAETLVNMDDYEDKFDFIKSAKFKVNVENVTEGIKEIGKSKTGAELLKKIIKKGKKQKTKDKNELQTIEGQSVYLGVGDPNLYLASQEKITDIDYFNKVRKLRSIFRGGIIEGDKIKEIYGPVDGSSEEIKTVANYLKPLKSTILLGDDANEINLKEMEMNQFKIIHFATHGEISGALEGLNEPFLVLTPPDEASEANDGLLTMTEIMALNTNADLVVLSACNTAAGDMPGTEGFSGLAKSFFISGSKSILVSNWYVETLSAQELVINLFKNIKEHPELTVSENFKSTMIEQLGKHKDKSHPLFWAPFIIVGKDNKFSFNL